MHKPTLNVWQIWNMCFGFFGIQVGFGLQNANVSRIFQTLGAEVEALPILWIAAPLTGLLVQPVVGYMSDRTWGRLGRRRPYFFYGALATTAALIVMPNAPYLWVAAGMLWIMDASINVTMEPFRAFVGDMLPHRQRTMGFAMQSFFIGVGAVFASALPWILANGFGVANIAPEGVIPPSVKIAFYVGAACVLFAVMWTVFSTKEYPPDTLAAFEKTEPALGGTEAQSGGAETAEVQTLFRWGGISLAGGGLATIIVAQVTLGNIRLAEEALKLNDLYFVTVGMVAFGLVLIIAGLIKQRGLPQNPFSEIIDDLFCMPRTMRQLAVVQFFSWFALFSMWIYATASVTAFHFGASDVTTTDYAQGADWVGVLFAVYNGFAALAAFTIPPLAARIGRPRAHALNLVLGALGLMSFYVIRDPNLLIVSMIGVGFAWASILSVPYSILSGALPAKKMGVYMGIFNFFIVIPQLLAASILGLFVRYAFGGEAVYALALGGVSLLAAAGATLLVDDQTAEVATLAPEPERS
ncbi:MAG: MFS transporter [Pseudomonadota bacterium]